MRRSVFLRVPGFRTAAAHHKPGRSALAAAVATVMLVSLGGSGVDGTATARHQRPADRPHVAADKPDQRWGSAASGSHLTRPAVNRNLPQSYRGQYPLHQFDGVAEPGRNEARVVDPPTVETPGFDPATSRERAVDRGRHQRVFDNADGTRTTEFAAEPVNYELPGGGWAPIDTDLVAAGADVGGGWRNAADAVDLRLAPQADAADLVRLTLDGQHSIEYGVADAAEVAGTHSVAAETAGGTQATAAVTYPGALPHVDVRLEARPGGVKETLVLHSADAAHTYRFPLRLRGLTARLVDGEVRFVDGSGVVRAVVPPGYMSDAGTGAQGPATSTGVRYRLTGPADQPVLEMTLDSAWLRDPARVYPVEVDPTVGPPVTERASTSSMYVHGSTSVSGGNELLIGRSGSANAAAYLKFDNLGQLANHTVHGVAMTVVSYDAPSCRPRPVAVHPVTAGWSVGTHHSWPGPAVGKALASRSFANGYVATGQSQSACPAASELFDLGVAGRDLVQGWVDGTRANNGLSLRAPVDDSSAWKKFAGTGTPNGPRLYVTHSPYNAGYAIPNPVPEPAVLQNRDGQVAVTVTNRSAEAWTPANYYLAYRAYNAETGAAVTQQRAGNLPGTVARNGKATVTATIKRLPPGVYFLDFTMVRTGGVVFTDHQVPPARIVLHVIDIEPVVQEVHPPNGYPAPTLTPLLYARAVDPDAPPSLNLQYKFELCATDDDGEPVDCTSTAYQASQAWAVPAGRMTWSTTYLWRAVIRDANNEVPTPYSMLVTSVPQPDITSKIAGAPNAAVGQEYDAQTGNLTTAAVDAVVATVGPELNVVRTYNSLDPRRDLGTAATGLAAVPPVFGAGWASRYDMRVVPDDDGTGNLVVVYPDGQTVRFGRNPDGSFAAPLGRVAQLTEDATHWRLRDQSGTTYSFFRSTGKITEIVDNASRRLRFTYNTADGGRLGRVQAAATPSDTTGRSLWFVWNGNRIDTIRTDPVNGSPLSWRYHYTGDLLTRVCAPDSSCTEYEYTPASRYHAAVLDARPDSYWRFAESQGTAAGSEIATNLGKDAGTYTGVTLGAAGPIAGTADTAASFNGTSARVTLPKGTVKKSRDASVELWFRVGLTHTGGPLIGYQDTEFGSTAGTGVPLLYTGTDGRLRGQFAGGGIAPITSAATVNDNQWHHVVLTSMGTTQTLYLDGVKVGEATGRTIDHALLTYNQVGAAVATSPTAWPGWGTTAQRHFAGQIDEVAVYARPLGPGTVAEHFRAAQTGSHRLTTVLLPSGKTAIEARYHEITGRITEYTDSNGGTWKVGAPTVFGSDTDLRRSVQVLDPANRPHLYEYDALAGRLLRSGTPLGLETRQEDLPGPPPTSSPSPPTEVCSQPDPNDPAFCTIIPDDSGGPVFIRHPLEGMAIRTYTYDEQGRQKQIRDENDHGVELGYDDRGNVTSRKSCRTSTECHTTYYTYPAGITDPYDLRAGLATEVRDGRSSSATDNRYRTTSSYHFTGKLISQTGPDNVTVTHQYTTGGEPAFGGGNQPTGLLDRTRAPTAAPGVERVTRYFYYRNGDLARTVDPAGLTTEYTYDPLGRLLTEKEISDSFPAGVVTTYTWDTHSRLKSETGPVTTDAVTGEQHQQHAVNDYDADGNLIATTVYDLVGDEEPRTATTEYDEHNRPVRVVDAEGNETSLSYDRFGNKTSETDPNGNRYDYAYTNQNKLAEVRLRNWRSDPPGGPGTGDVDYLVLHSYSYDFAGRLASDTDAMGRRLEYTYYHDDLLEKVVLKGFRNPDGSTRDQVIERNVYDGAGNLVRREEGNGTTVTEHTLDNAGRITSTVEDPDGVRRRTDLRYNAAGEVDRITRSGNTSNVPWLVAVESEIVNYVYHVSGGVARETVVAGDATRVTTHTYDQRGVRTSTTEPRGNVPGADAAAFTTRFVSDELGRQTRITGPAVAAESGGGTPTTVTPTVTAGYNAFGEQVATRDPLGNVTRTEYDRLGRPVRTIAPSYTPPGAPTPITPTVRTSYDPLGNVVETVDARNAVTRYAYDQLNRMVSRDAPGTTNEQRAVWHYTYTRTGEVLSVTDPTGARTESTYDDLDRPVTQTVVERHPVVDNFTTTLRYDDAGNVTSVISPSGATMTSAYNGVGELIRMTSPAGVVTQYGYDRAGRQVRVADGLGRTARTSYNLFGDRVAQANLNPAGDVVATTSYGHDAAGNVVTVTDPEQAVSQYAYDAAGRLVSQVEQVSATKSITTTFGYDAAGNRTRYTDGRGHEIIYTVNTLGLAESVVEPPTTAHPDLADRTWTVAYDGNGNAQRLTAPGGVTRQRVYDAANRLVEETGAGAETTTAARSLGYDLAGRLTRAGAPGDDDTFSYNDRGGLLTAAGPAGTASFSYDADGNLTGRTDAAGTTTFSYVDARLDEITDAVTGQPQTLSYDAAGAVRGIDYGAGRVRTFSYDDVGRLTDDVLRNSGGQTVASIVYDYDLAGQLTGKTTTGTAGAGAHSYDYDDAGRLVSWTGPDGTVAYEWDDAGNRTRAGPKTAVYDERNRLVSDGDYTYGYSARGALRTRVSSGLVEQYAFDAFDRMTFAEGESYAYDALNRVVSRGSTAFQYAGLSTEVVSDGTETYARGAGDELLAVGRGTEQRLTLSDAHGDVVAAFDPTSGVLPSLPDSTAFDPFGEPTASQGDTGNIGYQGDWTDPDTGKVNMGARWYTPGTGGFASRDSVTYSAGASILANRYTYGAGAPLNYDDPTGHWPSWVDKGINKVKRTASNAWNTTKSWASSTWNTAKSWGISAWNWGVSALRTFGSQLKRFSNWVYHKSGAATVVNKVSEGVQAVRDGNFRNWAAEQAAQAVQITQRAKQAVENYVQNKVVPRIKAAVQPLVAGARTLVSTTARVAAAVTAVTVTAIKDPQQFANTLALEAAKQYQGLTESINGMVDSAAQFWDEHKATITGAVVGGVIGIGCGVAIGWTGAGAVACGVAAGAIGAAVTGYMQGQRGWELAGTALLGGATGVLGAFGGALLGSAARAAAPALRALGGRAMGALSSGAQNAVRGAVSSTRSAVRSGVESTRNLANRLMGKCNNSFVATTPVLMADGSRKPISDVEVGDVVLATDPTTGRTEGQEVTGLIVGTGEKNLVEVTVDLDGADGDRTGTITATDNHPFWVESENRWVDAVDLKPGYAFETADHRPATVAGIRAWTEYETVHNLTVDTLHTYYVTAADTPVLVHNCVGEATVFFDGGHATIRTTVGGDVMHTHQLGGLVEIPGMGRVPTPVRPARFDGEVSPAARSATVHLPNPGGAFAYQEVQLDKAARGFDFGMYDETYRTCFHYCARVLEAGGVQGVPAGGTAREIIAFLRRLERS
ncbi:RHS repeat-associated core domain-containing protein [Solwaraspora sp. WMMA2056]|uniref:LamG-like jellyroll fold domain-containing protein n=1 Tax=Solwaraspora sp. WMMA2056 TaxID=3015161 RepID=UPI00259BE4A9|nr:LamG-like jellyroll fold domain-containing protein [Solwaraspora sp. WMMA2056]WJK42519.1 RHS repeat-associated core domain-containing protein [Solwaraspora sp. WMMA2056]